MTLNCAWLHKNLSYDCRAVKTLNGDPAYEIGTPFSFTDGSAIVFYVVDMGSHTLLSDNADTLFHLQSVGLDPYSRRRESTIRNILSPFGASLETNGEVRMLGPSAATAHSVSTFITAMLAIAAQERAWLGVPAAVNEFADEVEHYLRLWKPSQDVLRQPKVKGISNHEYEFAFLWGDELVDVITPSHQATGGLMRKLGDVLSAPGDKKKVRVVIDDRNDFERAQTEKQIIGSMASAMLYTSLQKVAGQQALH